MLSNTDATTLCSELSISMSAGYAGVLYVYKRHADALDPRLAEMLKAPGRLIRHTMHSNMYNAVARAYSNLLDGIELFLGLVVQHPREIELHVLVD